MVPFLKCKHKYECSLIEAVLCSEAIILYVTAHGRLETSKNLYLLVLLTALSGESTESTDTVTKESSFPSLAANCSQLIQFPPALSDSAHDCI